MLFSSFEDGLRRYGSKNMIKEVNMLNQILLCNACSLKLGPDDNLVCKKCKPASVKYTDCVQLLFGGIHGPELNQWNAAIIFKDENKQQPTEEISFYVWSMQTFDWAKHMSEDLSNRLGYGVEISNLRHRGNGHGEADIKRLSSV